MRRVLEQVQRVARVCRVSLYCRSCREASYVVYIPRPPQAMQADPQSEPLNTAVLNLCFFVERCMLHCLKGLTIRATVVHVVRM